MEGGTDQRQHEEKDDDDVDDPTLKPLAGFEDLTPREYGNSVFDVVTEVISQGISSCPSKS